MRHENLKALRMQKAGGIGHPAQRGAADMKTPHIREGMETGCNHFKKIKGKEKKDQQAMAISLFDNVACLIFL